MRKRIVIPVIAVCLLAALAASIREFYRSKFPYGRSHCCITQMMLALEQYAMEHRGRYPAGEATPEASLCLLFKIGQADPNTLRGMIVPEDTVRHILETGQLLGPDTCGWHYAEGLTQADDKGLALLWCKEALGHNGERHLDSGRQVLFVGARERWIVGDEWPDFLKEQTELLAQRSDRAKSGMPLVDAVIELPGGRQIDSFAGSYTMSDESKGVDFSASGSHSGSRLIRDSIVWFHAPLQTGYVTRTLSFSDLTSDPVKVTFKDGIPDVTKVVFKMRDRRSAASAAN